MGRPSWLRRVGSFDNSRDEFRRGGGGFEQVFVVDLDHYDVGTVPSRVAYEGTPYWPTAIELRFRDAPVGRYRLVLDLLSDETPAVAVVRIADVVLGFLNRGPGQLDHWEFDFSVTDAAERGVTVEVISGGQVTFDAMRLEAVGPLGVVHQITEAVGHLAAIDEVLAYETAAGTVRERRTWTLQSDSPWVSVVMHRDHGARSWTDRRVARLGPFLGLEPSAGSEAPPFVTGIEYRLPSCLLLRQASGSHPAIAILVHDAGPATTFEWLPTGEIVLLAAAQRRGDVNLALSFLVLDGLYNESHLELLHRELTPAPVPSLHVPPAGSARIENASSVPRIRVVRVEPSGDGPYLAGEVSAQGDERWWTTRPAQVRSSDGADLVKIYLQPQADALLCRWGFVRGVVRPGWESQHQVALADPPSRENCLVQVLKTGPWVFAPRIEYAEPFDSVVLDGAPWAYHDGRHVFLPNRRGTYQIAVRDVGVPQPRITRTWASIRRATIETDPAGGLRLEVLAEHPEHFHGSLPGDLSYVLEIDPSGYRLDRHSARSSVELPDPLEGNQLRPPAGDGFLIRITPGSSGFQFQPAAP